LALTSTQVLFFQWITTILSPAEEVEALWIAVVLVGHRYRFRCPVGRHKPAEAAAVVAGTEHVEAGFGIAFFAGELVVY
jgi:hypothetical protein